MFVGEVVDETVGIYGNVNTVNADVGMGEVIRLDGGDGHGGEVFLFDKGRTGVHRRGGSGGRFDDGKDIGDRGWERDGGV